jgi:hypothetical protein
MVNEIFRWVKFIEWMMDRINLQPGTVKVWDEGIENNLQRKLMNAPCLQSKDVNWIEVRPNFHSRNLTFCLGLHNCRPFCCTFFQYDLQRGSPSNALPCLQLSISDYLWWKYEIKFWYFWQFVFLLLFMTIEMITKTCPSRI